MAFAFMVDRWDTEIVNRCLKEDTHDGLRKARDIAVPQTAACPALDIVWLTCQPDPVSHFTAAADRLVTSVTRVVPVCWLLVGQAAARRSAPR